MRTKKTKTDFYRFLEEVRRTRDERLRLEAKKYEGIRDVDGWEIMERTVRTDHAPADAIDILRILAE